MSQFYKGVTEGNLPPTVILQITTDYSQPDGLPGAAVAANNNINLLGGYTSDNDDNGIRTDNDTLGSDNVYIELTNRILDTETTTDATPTQMAAFDASGFNDGTFLFEGRIVVYNQTDQLGATYKFVAGATVEGGVVTELGTEFEDVFIETGMEAVTIDFIALVGSVLVLLTGLGTAMDPIVLKWKVVYEYIYVDGT